MNAILINKSNFDKYLFKCVNTFNGIFKGFSKIYGKTFSHKLLNNKHVGTMLETLMGIDANNSKLCDIQKLQMEVKTHTGTSLTTSFTKSPDGGMNIPTILEKYGYSPDKRLKNKNGKILKKLNTAVTFKPNNLGFWLKLERSKLFLMRNNKKLAFWYVKTLLKSIVSKMPNLAYFEYEFVGRNIKFTNLTIYKKLDILKFKNLLKSNNIIIEIRIRHGYLTNTKEGMYKDRGCAIRLTNNKLFEHLFKTKKAHRK